MFELIRLIFSKIDVIFIKKIRVLSVKARFFLMVIAISVIPILVIGVISYKKSDKDIISKMSVYSQQLVGQVSSTVNQKLLNWQKYGDIIATSQNIQDILALHQKSSVYEDYASVREMETFMKETLKVALDINEPDMITTFGDVISPAKNSQPFVNDIDKEKLNKMMEMTKEAEGRFIWNTDNIAEDGYLGSIVISRSIKDLDTFKKTLGYLMIQVDNNYLYELYKDVDLGHGSSIFLLDSKNLIVSSKNSAEIGSYFVPAISKIIKGIYEKGVDNITVKNAGKKYLLSFSRIPETGWSVVALIPNTYIKSLSKDIFKLVVIVGIICLIVSLLFFTLIYRSITVPLGQVIKSMREVKKGNLESRTVNEDERDEVGEVINSYNKMICELNLHIENIKAKEKQKALAEFRALQAQINPHFIANTLNNVAWLAKMQKADNIEIVVTSLVQLLNASMGKGEDIIPIKDEIENIKSYISIMKYKYFKEIDVHFDMDDDILEYKILRFVLQPIIENAIIHGIGPKQGQGLISMKGYIDNGDITIIVTDTGIGIEKDSIDDLLNGEKESKDRFSSIGLKNVNERIKLSYGDKYGILIKSQKEIFTSVEIKLPVIS